MNKRVLSKKRRPSSDHLPLNRSMETRVRPFMVQSQSGWLHRCFRDIVHCTNNSAKKEEKKEEGGEKKEEKKNTVNE